MNAHERVQKAVAISAELTTKSHTGLRWLAHKSPKARI